MALRFKQVNSITGHAKTIKVINKKNHLLQPSIRLYRQETEMVLTSSCCPVQ